jgi:predicted permease
MTKPAAVTSPPRGSRALLARLLPAAVRADVLGDMDDSHAEIAARHGIREAGRWYRAHVRGSIRMALAAHFDNLRGRHGRDTSLFPTRGDGLMRELVQDLRYAVRWWRHNPGFTAVALLTLAVGIGANTAMFSVVFGVLLSPLPYPDGDRIVRFYNTNDEAHQTQQSLSLVELAEYTDNVDMFEAFAGLDVYPVTLTGGEEPVRVRASIVTGEFFAVFGSPAVLGRTFGEEATRAGDDDVAVISHGLWQRAFGGASDVLSQDLRVNGRPRQILGVMPADFDFYPSTDVWIPMVIDRATLDPDQIRSHGGLVAVARTAPGSDLAATQEAGDRMVAAVLEQYPQHDSYHGALLVPLTEWYTGSIRPMLLTLVGAVGFMLLIVCANVASLLLSRAEGRRRELAVRAALGAGRARLARQLVTESAALALLGGTLGVFAAYITKGALVTELAAILPRTQAIALSWPVLLFSLVVTLLAGLLFGLAPTLRGSTRSPGDTLRGAAGSHRASANVRLRGGLVTAQVALVVALLMGAALVGQSFWNLAQIEPGIEVDRVLAFDVELPETGYATQPEVARTFEQISARVAGLPNVASVGAVSWLPFADFPSQWGIEIDGVEMPEDTELPDWTLVSGDYFAAIGIPVLRGRDFIPEDRDTGVIVTAAAAELYWPGDNPLGKRLRLDSNPGWRTVVGVVGDYKNRGLDAEARHSLYFPHVTFNFGGDWFARRMSFAVKTTGEPMQAVPTVREAIWSLDAELPLARLQPLDAVLAATMSQPRVTMLFLVSFAGLALFLGAIGIHGVVAQSVAAGQRDIGIRMALGARASSVLRRVVSTSMWRIGIGMAVGLLAGYWATQAMMTTLLFGVTPADPTVWISVIAVLGAVGLIATLIPAMRALRVDPVTVLRGD